MISRKNNKFIVTYFLWAGSNYVALIKRYTYKKNRHETLILYKYDLTVVLYFAVQETSPRPTVGLYYNINKTGLRPKPIKPSPRPQDQVQDQDQDRAQVSKPLEDYTNRPSRQD